MGPCIGRRDRPTCSRTRNRARRAGFSALVVTIDTPVAGLRERDLRNGIKELVQRRWSMLPYVAQILRKPVRPHEHGLLGELRPDRARRFEARRAVGKFEL